MRISRLLLACLELEAVCEGWGLRGLYVHVKLLCVAGQLLAQLECEERLLQQPDHPELGHSDLPFHSVNQIV